MMFVVFFFLLFIFLYFYVHVIDNTLLVKRNANKFVVV